MVPQRYIPFALAVLSTLLTATTSLALPISSCSGTGNAFTCYLYPSDPSGNPSTTSTVDFAGGIDNQTPGYLVLLDAGDPTTDDGTQTDWAEVVTWPDDATGTSNQVTLCDDLSCFPTYDQVIDSGDPYIKYYFTDQNANGIYNYPLDTGLATGPPTYIIYTATAAAAVTPEPTTTGLILLGLIGLFVIRKRLIHRVTL